MDAGTGRAACLLLPPGVPSCCASDRVRARAITNWLPPGSRGSLRELRPSMQRGATRMPARWRRGCSRAADTLLEDWLPPAHGSTCALLRGQHGAGSAAPAGYREQHSDGVCRIGCHSRADTDTARCSQHSGGHSRHGLPGDCVSGWLLGVDWWLPASSC
jgi:hypothetical protein